MDTVGSANPRPMDSERRELEFLTLAWDWLDHNFNRFRAEVPGFGVWRFSVPSSVPSQETPAPWKGDGNVMKWSLSVLRGWPCQGQGTPRVGGDDGSRGDLCNNTLPMVMFQLALAGRRRKRKMRLAHDSSMDRDHVSFFFPHPVPPQFPTLKCPKTIHKITPLGGEGEWGDF